MNVQNEYALLLDKQNMIFQVAVCNEVFEKVWNLKGHLEKKGN